MGRCSESCPVSSSTGLGGRFIDLGKSSDDVVYRLALIIPSLIGNTQTPLHPIETAVLCGTAGVMASGWQQLRQMIHAEPLSAVLAHSALAERLSNLQKYYLQTPDEISSNLSELDAEYEKKRRALKKLASGELTGMPVLSPYLAIPSNLVLYNFCDGH